MAGLLLVAALAQAGEAQRGGGSGGGGRGAAIRGAALQGAGQTPDQRLLQILRQRLELTDAQAARLQETNRRFRERRVTLGAEERRTRGAMRDLICSGDTTQVTQMAQLVDQWLELGRQRLDLQVAEQRDLATFLSPYQRAKYLGFEEFLGRLIDGRGRGGPPPGEPGRGGRGFGRGGPPGGGPPGSGMRGPPPDGPVIPDGCGPPEARGG